MKEAANIMQAYYSSPEGALRQSRIDSYMISSKKNAQWDQKLVKIITELSKLQRQDSTALFSLSRFSFPIRHSPLLLLPPHSILHLFFASPLSTTVFTWLLTCIILRLSLLYPFL